VASDLALATADATDPRYDLVVARLNSGAPEYFVVTGTPDPAPVEPTPTAAQAPCARVRVNAGATSPSSIADRREFGVLGVERLEASSKLDAGDDGRTLKVRDNGGANPTVALFDDVTGLPVLTVYNGSGAPELVWLVGSGPLTLAGLTGDLIIPAEQIAFEAAIKRKYDMHADDFTLRVGTALEPGAFSGGAAGRWSKTSGSGAVVRSCVRVPNGGSIKAVRAYGEKTADAAAHLILRLFAVAKGSNDYTLLAEVDNDGGAIGTFTLADASLAHAVTQASVYVVEVEMDAAGGAVYLHSAEVEYDEIRPFDGI
jgi:hypothetical protein